MVASQNCNGGQLSGSPLPLGLVAPLRHRSVSSLEDCHTTWSDTRVVSPDQCGPQDLCVGRVSRPARTTLVTAADLCLRRLDAASGNSSSDSTPWSPVAPVAKDLEWKITSLDSLAPSSHPSSTCCYNHRGARRFFEIPPANRFGFIQSQDIGHPRILCKHIHSILSVPNNLESSFQTKKFITSL
ncbi:hypothetical protein THAOC_35365 [Thalassiosira oceanica]|uniref:Uncharacterized protein n=1 Tax=Thalassiosira oceanica TaxID=159749 RepID=K0R3H9_THAOC|nr:hypothetical protein THAOC_35365 [Thalassiosira oceanica]|eukprot:EJK45994.1 hypothetical protein THAOC_35365 [Thalassiosira oceanica]